ncbi:hypothetical protein EG329_010817 [Mollisiaceae sp. DMI_Dod_QoI]|nr:hypothetical protein EG329_010817 [Helotiales sp. DMI_Dod_QoI]
MPPLKTGSCDTCSAEDVKLRPNPFTNEEQCEACRDASIIGISDIKSRFKLKDDDLKGLKMVTEPQPAFLGGPDRRWYLVEEVEKRAEEAVEKKEVAKKEKEAAKEAAKKEKEEAKEAAKKEKEEAKEAAKKEKEEAKKAKVSGPTKDVKRKRDQEDPEQKDSESELEHPVKRGRGRPRKAPGSTPVTNGDGKPKRGRGRPPKAKKVEE